MQHVCSVVLGAGFLFAVAAPARADEADAKAIIEKAVKAHGGQANLDKYPGSTVTFKGKFYGLGEGLPMSGSVTSFGGNKQRVEIEIDVNGMTIPVLVVFNGEKGWNKVDKDTKELDKDELAEMKEETYAGWVTTLAPLLKDKQFKFSTIGDLKVDKITAVGVKVSSKGHRDVDLYFDKETGLLVKAETRVKDDTSGQEVTEENFPSEYKDVQGVKQAMKFTVKRDGKPYLEGEAKDVKMIEKLDPDVFAKP